MPEIRPFRRDDRDQLTALVNAHVAAVVPGVHVSVNALLSQLEREPGETIVDPWVVERRTIVAIERDAVVAAAHLHRYGDDERVGPDYRGAAYIRWLIARPGAVESADALLRGCLAVFAGWEPARQHADGSLPAPFVYGIPAQWPHVRDALARNGFVHDGRVELILQAAVTALPAPARPPLADVELRRSVGAVGTRLSAVLGGEEIGLIEVEQISGTGRSRDTIAWADIGNLGVRAEHRRRGLATWLLGHARAWLELGGVERLAAYASPEQRDELAFLAATGFRELTRTERGWTYS